MTNASSPKITKAVIPIAGNGTRMFPETHFIKKVMLPVPDRDGTIKPALMYMLEELAGCGIEDIYLIVAEGEPEEYERFFEFEFDKGFEAHLPEKVRGYYKKIRELGEHIHYVVQYEKKGFGHAVYQARQYLGKEPAVLLLGDFLYRSASDRSCTRQAIDAHISSGGKTVVGLAKIDVDRCMHYGIVHGTFDKKESCILDADMMVEKPDMEFAKENLLVDGNCYATFGNYILTDEVFVYVRQVIEEKERTGSKEETDLTGAFSHLAKNGRLVGALIDGESFDVGIPDMYRKTFAEFGR